MYNSSNFKVFVYVSIVINSSYSTQSLMEDNFEPEPNSEVFIKNI